MKQKLKKQLKLKSKILINEYPDFFHDNSLNKAYNFLSYINGFNDYHELEKVLNKNLNDKRLNFLKPFHFVDINYQENRVLNLIKTIYNQELEVNYFMKKDIHQLLHIINGYDKNFSLNNNIELEKIIDRENFTSTFVVSEMNSEVDNVIQEIIKNTKYKHKLIIDAQNFNNELTYNEFLEDNLSENDNIIFFKLTFSNKMLSKDLNMYTSLIQRARSKGKLVIFIDFEFMRNIKSNHKSIELVKLILCNSYFSFLLNKEERLKKDKATLYTILAILKPEYSPDKIRLIKNKTNDLLETHSIFSTFPFYECFSNSYSWKNEKENNNV